MSIANEILKQLGGNKFIAMTGAKNLIDGGNYLAFKLPARFAKDGINYVKVEHTSRDEYNIFFQKINYRNLDIKEIAEIKGFYADHLVHFFENYTGLYTRL